MTAERFRLLVQLRSYMVAHRLMLLVLAVVVAVIYSVPGGRDTYIPIAAIVTGIMALLLTHLLMPLLVAGWRQPDPPPDDDEDEDEDGDGETA